MILILPVALLAMLIALIGNGRSHVLEVLCSKGFWKDYFDGR